MQHTSHTISSPARVLAGLAALVAVLWTPLAGAQSYRTGQHVEPAYEGWRPNPDGTFNFMFGYMNENWEEEPKVSIGENNYFSPGEPDQGQPTHFLPRRNRFTFEVTVPADWGDKELVWTLNVNGVERKAYATLRQDYLVDNMVIASETGSLGAGTSSPESRANVPPVLTVQGDLVRTARVGEPVNLSTHVWDDGLPERRRESTNTSEELERRMMRRPSGSLLARLTVCSCHGTCTAGQAMSLSILRCQSHGKTRALPPTLPGERSGCHQKYLKMASTKSMRLSTNLAPMCCGHGPMMGVCTTMVTSPYTLANS